MTYRLLQLRTDPFYPGVDTQDNPILPAALERSLNPLVDVRVLHLYFDIYDWTASALLNGISGQGTINVFPNSRTLPADAPLLVIMTGQRDTGLDSLANLVVHQIKTTSAKDPLVCDVVLEGRDKNINLEAVAIRMMDVVQYHQPALPNGKSLAQEMRERYDRPYKGTPAQIFQAFGNILKPLNRELIIKIDKGGDSDSWARVYEAVRGCCSWVLVLTPECAYSRTCYNALTNQGQNVSWIRALPLDQNQARLYVERRVAAGRLSGQKPPQGFELFPFTDAAIATLYEPGQTAGGQPLKHPIGWLRKTLHKAIEDQIAKSARSNRAKHLSGNRKRRAKQTE